MPVLTDWKSAQADLIRKALDAAIVVAPVATAIPTAFTTGSGSTLAALPTGFKGLGYVTKDDGLSWSRDVSAEETTSYGSVTPTRRDLVSDTTTVTFTCQETNLQVMQQFYGVDLSAVTPTATTGEVAFSQPLSPSSGFTRLIAIGQDGVGTDTIYVIRILPRAQLSEVGEQTWTDSGEIAYPLTYTATPDNTLGYAVRHVFGGPGWKSRLVSMGFPAAT